MRMPALPFKLNQDRRHHIPRQQHKVTNWPAYEAGLRQRGSLTVWFSDEAVAAWAAAPRTTRGGQPSYSPLAILTALTLRAVFRLAYRQAEGLIASIISLLGLALRVPDHTTLSRRFNQDVHREACLLRDRSDQPIPVRCTADGSVAMTSMRGTPMASAMARNRRIPRPCGGSSPRRVRWSGRGRHRAGTVTSG